MERICSPWRWNTLHVRHRQEALPHVIHLDALRVGARTLYIEPGNPWKNGYNESFNGKLKDELLGREISCSLREAKVLVEQRRREYNTIRPTVPWDIGRRHRR